MGESICGGLALVFTDVETDGFAVELSGDDEIGSRSHEWGEQNSAGWEAVGYEGADKGFWFLGFVDGVPVAGTGGDDGSHEPGSAVFADIGVCFSSASPLRWLVFAANDSFSRIHRELRFFVHFIPRGSFQVEMEGEFVNPAEAVVHES